jgi:hypothetical protein
MTVAIGTRALPRAESSFPDFVRENWGRDSPFSDHAGKDLQLCDESIRGRSQGGKDGKPGKTSLLRLLVTRGGSIKTTLVLAYKVC